MINISTTARPIVARMVIHGQLVAASNNETFPVYNPATNDLLANVPKGTLEDVEKAVQSAQTAYDDQEWQKMSANKRGRLLYAFAALVRRDQEHLATLEMLRLAKRGPRLLATLRIAPRCSNTLVAGLPKYMDKAVLDLISISATLYAKRLVPVRSLCPGIILLLLPPGKSRQLWRRVILRSSNPPQQLH